MINICICDDDENILKHVQTLISKNLKINHKISTHNNGYNLKLYIKDKLKGNVQIIILDIDLKDHLGTDIATTLKKDYPQVKIIFMTGFVDYVEEIFDVDPVYYLAKPIKEEKLVKALEKAVYLLENEKSKNLILTTKDEVINISYNQINYLCSNLRTVTIYCDKFSKTIYAKLKDIEDKLPNNFIRCHQSYIVNLDKIVKLNNNSFELRDKTIIPISQSKYKLTRIKLFEYLEED